MTGNETSVSNLIAHARTRSRSSLFKSLFDNMPRFRRRTSRSFSEGLIAPRSPRPPNPIPDTPRMALNNPPLSPRPPLSPNRRSSLSQRSSLESADGTSSYREGRASSEFKLSPPPRRPVRTNTGDSLGLGLRMGRSSSSTREDET